MTPAPRYVLRFPVTIYSLVKGTERTQKKLNQIRGFSHNLSLTGIGLEISGESPLQEGDLVVLVLEVDDSEKGREMLSFQSQVIWRNQTRCGIQIVKARENSKTLYKYILDGYHFLTTVNALADI